jgi:hypothetical protein
MFYDSILFFTPLNRSILIFSGLSTHIFRINNVFVFDFLGFNFVFFAITLCTLRLKRLFQHPPLIYYQAFNASTSNS